MKKFKTILSIALVCVLTLSGGMMLTGCTNSENNKTIINNINNTVINESYDEHSTPYDNGSIRIEFKYAHLYAESANQGLMIVGLTLSNLTDRLFDKGDISISPINIYSIGKVYDHETNEYLFSSTLCDYIDLSQVSIGANFSMSATESIDIKNPYYIDDRGIMQTDHKFVIEFLGHEIARFTPLIIANFE